MLKLNDFLRGYIKESAGQLISEGDLIEIIPIRGRKKIITLNRSRFNIQLNSNSMEVVKDISRIEIPAIKNRNFEIRLTLHQADHDNYFYIEAINQNYFILNGNLSSFSVPRNGDLINIGFTKIYFRKKIKSKKSVLKNKIIKPNYLSSSIPILLTGETGTGKTTMAKKIHDESGAVGNFVQLNLSSFSKSLIESEIFGHRKGAFTGAISDKKGAILEANRGTLFLDEIDSIDIGLQTKLLTFLDNGEFRVVGGANQTSNVRMIYSSGKNLKELVTLGKMRIDFYFRLKNSLCIEIPNLRDNKVYLKKVIHEILEENSLSIGPRLMNFYLKYPWPGNIRQLKSHIQRKLIEQKGTHLELDHLDLILSEDRVCFRKAVEKSDYLTLSEVKKKYIQEILMINEGDLKATSKHIGVSENTIRRCV